MTKQNFLDKYFMISERKSNVKTELGAGLATFMTMSYILIVHPTIMVNAGMPQEQVFTVTALTSCIFTLFMGLYAKLPFALAPAMGSNAFLAFTLVGSGNITWQQGLAMNIISGVVFLIMSLFGFREVIVKFLPKSLKLGIGATVGIFLIELGFKNGNLMKIVNNSITIGDVKSPSAITALFGIAITTILVARKVKCDMLLGIISATLIGIPLGVTKIPASIISLPSNINDIAFKLDFSNIFTIEILPILFVFFVGDFFSTLGTLLGVSEKAGLLDENGDLPDIQKPFIVDALGTVVGAALGTTTITTFVESAAGVGAGGRTGLTSISTGALFFLSLFLSPLALMVPGAATAPTLIIMGILMLSGLKNIEYDDFTESFPVFFMIISTAFTNSIANGVGAGIISYTVIKAGSGKAKEVSLGLYILSAVMVLYFVK
ncbi:NCS2 family permease [Fusobacterium sp.]|uniref:NCS2 family permease n=1 Tax=Fusobacterium sp. TaxID=68766 RepID=UPI002635F31E|nr:NCS2 family permease [Fusobacterium sp.]